MKSTNGGTIRLHPVHPAKVMFLACTLVIGGCASRPADLITKDSPSHYWKWIADIKSWVYFDATGKQAGIIREYGGLFKTEQLCKATSPTDISSGAVVFSGHVYYLQDEDSTYDTVLHAQAALEKACSSK